MADAVSEWSCEVPMVLKDEPQVSDVPRLKSYGMFRLKRPPYLTMDSSKSWDGRLLAIYNVTVQSLWDDIVSVRLSYRNHLIDIAKASEVTEVSPTRKFSFSMFRYDPTKDMSLVNMPYLTIPTNDKLPYVLVEFLREPHDVSIKYETALVSRRALDDHFRVDNEDTISYWSTLMSVKISVAVDPDENDSEYLGMFDRSYVTRPLESVSGFTRYILPELIPPDVDITNPDDPIVLGDDPVEAKPPFVEAWIRAVEREVSKTPELPFVDVQREYVDRIKELWMRINTLMVEKSATKESRQGLAYLHRLSRMGTWGDEESLLALSQLNNVRIAVHRSFQELDQSALPEGVRHLAPQTVPSAPSVVYNEDAPEHRTIHLFFSGGHYDLLIPAHNYWSLVSLLSDVPKGIRPLPSAGPRSERHHRRG